MRRWIGIAAFLTPVVLVLTAAAQTPVSGAAREIVGRSVSGVQVHVLNAVAIR